MKIKILDGSDMLESVAFTSMFHIVFSVNKQLIEYTYSIMMDNDDSEKDISSNVETVISMEQFLISKHEDEIIEILLSEDSHSHFPVHVNALELFDYSLQLSTQLVNSPMTMIPIFDQALINAQASIQNKYQISQSNLVVKSNCHVRISNLPICPELVRDKLPKSKDAGHFLSVTGTVIRCSLTKLLEFEREYMCEKCRFTFPVDAQIEQNYELSKPQCCPSVDGCNSTKFTSLDNNLNGPSKCRDYQELKIQEQVQKLKVGNIPRSITVIVENDLVDKCKPGDDVTVSGTVLRRWKNVYLDTKCEVELILKANEIVISNDQRSSVTLTDQLKDEFENFWRKYEHNPLQGRNEILSSFCPQVFGLYIVKLAVSLVLIGGVQRIKESGMRLRGESHLLLVGDPGTGKSQFLKYAVKLMPRSVLTTGIGSTSAGLTVTAVKEGGEWQLEAGALVLADGGICCIDEFNSIREHDKTSIHEAMEQQTISVAKAGLVCKLNTRTTILAATNPKGRYDKDESVSINIALASPLLSRFDIVLVLVDNQSQEWDGIISSFILKKRQLSNKSTSLWNLERMQCYFACAKSRNVRLTADAETILRTYYQIQRAGQSRNLARTTLRLLESMIRIAEAHARLMYRDEVIIQDAIMSVCLIEASMQNTALFPGNINPLRSSFPEDPEKQYIEEATVILRKLSLNEILAKVEELEQSRIAKLSANMQNETHQNVQEIGNESRNQSASVFNIENDDVLNENDSDVSLSPEVCRAVKRKSNTSEVKNIQINDDDLPDIDEILPNGHLSDRNVVQAPGHSTVVSNITKKRLLAFERQEQSTSDGTDGSINDPTLIVGSCTRELARQNDTLPKPFDQTPLSLDNLFNNSNSGFSESINNAAGNSQSQYNDIHMNSQADNDVDYLENDSSFEDEIMNTQGSIENEIVKENIENIAFRPRITEFHENTNGKMTEELRIDQNNIRHISDSTLQLNESGLIRQAIELDTPATKVENKFKRFKFRKK